MTASEEIFISVDVETSGPVPGEYSMLTLGACLVDDDAVTFEMSLKPIGAGFDPEAMKVTGLSLKTLEREGLAPGEAMAGFAEWIARVSEGMGRPVMVGFNAPFDWSFVNYYFHSFLGSNPFGFTCVDVKAVYMGATGSTWTDTRSSAISRHLEPTLSGDHDALHDARYQAELFRLVRALRLPFPSRNASGAVEASE